MKAPVKLMFGTSAAAIILSGLTGVNVASAQSAADVIEEIIVTAQKREKGLIDTPVAVSAFSGDTLADSSIRDIRDLQMLVPSYNVTQAQTSFQATVNIRALGTSSQNPGLEPSVGIFVDGVFRSRTGAAVGDFMSVERIEVLRGPQSTLFGKNTSAGVVSIITQQPEFETGGKVEASYGNYDQIVMKGTVTGPLVADKVAVRLSGNYNKRDGFLTNVADGSDVNDRDRWSLRGQMLIEASENVSIRLIADYAKADERCCAAPFLSNGPTSLALLALGGTVIGTPLGAADPFARKMAFDGELRGIHKDYGFSGQVDWDFGAATFTSITAYRDFESDSEIDADFTDLSLVARNGDLTKVKTFTQEFRFSSNGANTVDWQFGGFYFNQNLSADGKVIYGADTRPFFDLLSGFNFDPLFPGGPTLSQAFGIPQALVDFAFPSGLASRIDIIELALDPVTLSRLGASFVPGTGQTRELFNNDAESWALFGQFDWHLNERTTLTGGLRYTKENKHGVGTFTNDDFFSGLPLEAIFGPSIAASFGGFQFLPPLPDFDRRRSENKFTGNVILTYEANEDLTTYASFSRGYKAGGFDLSRGASDGTGNTFEFLPETVNNIEVGLKARILEGRGRVNVALYRQKVNDFQANIFAGTRFELRNAGTIKQKGVEVDAQIAATDNLDLTFAAAFNDSNFGTFTSAPCPIFDPATFCDLSGERLTDAPKWTLSNTATYSQPITDDMTGFVRGEVYYRGSRSVAGDADPAGDQSSTFILNASFGVQGGGDNQWELVFWGKNLTKENYVQTIFDSVAQSGSYNGYPNDPRTYGVTVRGRF